ncbi:MAG: hypothetical protein ABL994_14005, partial [Verrucomicrobiales bacterium]
MPATLPPTLCRWTCFLLLFASGISDAEEKPPVVAGLPSGKFDLYLNGIEVPVIAYKDIHYARFSLVNAAKVKVVT